MKENRLISSKTSCIFIVLFFIGFIINGCNYNKTKPKNNSITDELRPSELELNFVKQKAISFEKNNSGYWEATFERKITMIYIPEGSFNIGNDDVRIRGAGPSHKVNLSHYWINKTPVTIGQFRAFVEETEYVTEILEEGHTGPWVYDFDERGFITKYGYYWDNAFKDVIAKFPEITINDQHPVNCISWHDCIAFTDWLSEKTGLQFTLPTEAEWEYAARGADGRPYPWGYEEPDGTRANYADDTFEKYFPGTEQARTHYGVNDGFAITSPVGLFRAGKSPFGALDMAGNLTEWVFDYRYSYTTEEVANPICLIKNEERMMKAGFWAASAGRFDQSPDELEIGHNIRSDARQGDDPHSADDHLGFRMAISYTKRK